MGTVCWSAFKKISPSETSAIIRPSAKIPAPPNMRRIETGPKAENKSFSSSGFCNAAQTRGANASGLAGSSETDSPQPQAETSFGFLNTKRAESLSIWKSISLPIR